MQELAGELVNPQSSGVPTSMLFEQNQSLIYHYTQLICNTTQYNGVPVSL